MNNQLYNNVHIKKPTYDQFIIKPPAKNITHSKISDIYVADSRNRNIAVYEKPNNYRLKINNEYRDVTSVELVMAQIPNTGYNIYDGNNQILIEDSSGLSFVIKIENGEYTNDSLLNYLNGTKGNIFWKFAENNNQYFNFYVDKDTNLLTIQSNKEFKFNNVGIYKQSYTSNILNKCEQMPINEYFKLINFNSIDKSLGFIRKAYKSIEIFSDAVECDNACDNYKSNVIINIEEKAPNENILDCSYVKITMDSSNNCDLRKTYNKGDYIDIGENTYKILNIIGKDKMNIYPIDDGVMLDISNATIGTNNVLKSTNVYDIECPEYIILDIEQFNLLESDTNSIYDSFAIIPLDHSCKTIVNKTYQNHEMIKFFNPPLARLSHLNVNFKRYDDTSFNFNGKEHMFILKITSLNQPGKYNNSE
jgi:hypothetical protein